MAGEHHYAVILAGGGGTRLWPKSRRSFPKHFLTLFGNKTLLQLTWERILPLIPKERIFIVTLKDYVATAKKQLPDLLEKNIIAEPMSKNTALAMGVAAAYIHHRDDQAVIVNLAADQTIEDEVKFRKTIDWGLQTAAAGDYIAAIGIRPTFPHTGLGYIQIGEELDYLSSKKSGIFVFRCQGFKEKPDLATAQSFLATGRYLWNANLYSWSTLTLFKAMEQFSPNIYQGLVKIQKALGKSDEEKVVREVYQKSDNIQIDYAVSEKAKNLVVIPGEFGWSDVGDWKVIYDTHNKDKEGNVLNVGPGRFLGIDTKNCLIESNGKMVAAVGLENLVVVDTPDALLICSKDRAQDVKKVVEKLKEIKRDNVL